MSLIGGGSGGGQSAFTLPNNLFGDIAGDISKSPSGVSPAATKSDAETVRDNYFASNPDKLALYDADFRLNIRVLFMDSGNVSFANQVRQAGAWIDDAHGLGTDLTGITDRHLVAVVNGLPVDAGAKIDDDGNLFASTAQFGSATALFGDINEPTHAQSTAGENFTFTNLVSGKSYTPSGWANGSQESDWEGFHRKPVGDLVVDSPLFTVDSDDITNPTFTSPSASSRRDYALKINAVNPMTNCVVKVKEGGRTVFASVPTDIVQGIQEISFKADSVNFKQGGFLDLVGGKTYTVEVSSPDGDVIVKGNQATGEPWLQVTYRAWEDVVQANIEDIKVDSVVGVHPISVSMADKVATVSIGVSSAFSPTFVANHSTDNNLVFGGFASSGLIRMRNTDNGEDSFFQSDAPVPITDQLTWNDWLDRESKAFAHSIEQASITIYELANRDADVGDIVTDNGVTYIYGGWFEEGVILRLTGTSGGTPNPNDPNALFFYSKQRDATTEADWTDWTNRASLDYKGV